MSLKSNNYMIATTNVHEPAHERAISMQLFESHS